MKVETANLKVEIDDIDNDIEVVVAYLTSIDISLERIARAMENRGE